MTDTPRVFLAAYHDGLSPRYEVVPEGAMGAEPWVREGAGVRAKPGQIERHVWDAMVWAASSPPPPNGAAFPSYTDHGNSDAEVKAREASDRIRAALELTTEPDYAPSSVSMDDTRVFSVTLPDLTRAYQAAREADIDTVSAMWMNICMDCEPGPAPTSGAYDLICCTAEDVVQGRGFTGDAAADLAMAQESLRDCLKLLGWRG